jgi:uncharacterized DUF497 family protein
VPSPAVWDFAFDDENEDKFAAHGLSAAQVRQLLESPFVLVPNRRGRRAAYLLIGRDRGGGCIAAPIEPTREPTVWRPVTAWRCKAVEEARLAKEER